MESIGAFGVEIGEKLERSRRKSECSWKEVGEKSDRRDGVEWSGSGVEVDWWWSGFREGHLGCSPFAT
jgi:hypothetical protein